MPLLANSPKPLSNNDLRAATTPGRGSVMRHKTRTKKPFFGARKPLLRIDLPRRTDIFAHALPKRTWLGPSPLRRFVASRGAGGR